jgi:hypothetical protein
MGLRGVWVVAARCCAGTSERSSLHVQAQTCALRQGAVFIQDPFEGGPQRSAHQPYRDGIELEIRNSAGSVEDLDLVRDAGAGGTGLSASVKGNMTTLAHPHPVNRGV